MRGVIEETRTWHERLFSWPWRPWVAWKSTGLEGEVSWNGEAFVVTVPPGPAKEETP